MACLGVLNGMFVIFGSTKDLDYKISFSISASVCIVIAFILLFTIKDANYEKKNVENLPVK
jgi:hypothetical protein